MRSLVLLLIILVSLTTFAMADCEHDGKNYPTGTILGPLICTPDGTWQLKND